MNVKYAKVATNKLFAALPRRRTIQDCPRRARALDRAPRLVNLCLHGESAGRENWEDLDNVRRAFVFPGQGSQKVGMGADLASAFPAARAVFEMVDEALGERLSNIMFEGPDEELRLTKNTQPALMAMSMAVVRVIEDEGGQSFADMADAVAGHSLGEYSALAAAGAISLEDAARLLRRRGEAMQEAVPVGEGAMAALLGAEMTLAEEIVEAASVLGVCALANDNAPGQVVLSGAKPAIDRAVVLAKEKGVRKAVFLPVSAPFHCPLMGSAANIMAEALADVAIAPPTVPVFANVSAKAETEPERIRKLLVDQVTAMVRWRECVGAMRAVGVELLVEAGAGSVLKGLTKRIDKDLQAVTVGSTAEILSFL